MKAKTFLIAIPWLILLASAAWGLGVGGSGRVRTSTPYTFTATQTAPEWASSSADNTHYLNVNNSASHKSNPATGDIDTINGLPWIYNGSWVRILVTGDGASGYTAAPTYSDDTCTVGQWSTSSGYLFNCTATNTWTRTSLTAWNNPHSAPTLSSATIGTNGTTLTLAMSESVSVGTGGNGGFDVDCVTAGNNITATYSSGAPGSSLVYTLGTTVNSGDTCDLDYVQPGNGIEATTGGADLASITSASVTIQSSAPTQYAGSVGSVSGETYVGFDSTFYSSGLVVAGSTHTLKQIDFYISSITGTISSKTYTARVYSASGTSLGTLKGTSTGVSGADLTASAFHTFVFSTPVEVVSGDMIELSVDSPNDSNYIKIGIQYSSTDSGYASEGNWQSDKTFRGTPDTSLEVMYKAYE